MGLTRFIERLLGLAAEHDGDADHISSAARRAILRYEDTRGVDLPTWRTPKEREQMHRRERRAALRVVNGRTR